MFVDFKCEMTCDLACKFLFIAAVLTKVVFVVAIIKLITLNISALSAYLKWLFFVLVSSDLIGGYFVFKFYSLIKRVKG